MSKFRYKNNFQKLTILNFKPYSKDGISYKFKLIKRNKLKKDISILAKTKKIDKLISNIYIYKFPPILKWPEGLFIGIPVEIIIAIRKIFEHSSGLILNNVKELCFAFNVESSSYGDKIIILPIEYVYGKYSRVLFIDTFAHELGHALLEELQKDKYTISMFKSWHKTIKYYSIKHNKNLFLDIGNSEYSLAEYQMEDFKEFFSELYSQTLNYYNDIMAYVSKISFPDAQIAYINSVHLILNFISPFSKAEKQKLLKN